MPYDQLYEVRLECSFLNQQVINVFHGETLDPGFEAQHIMEAFVDTILPLWQSATTVSFIFERLYIYRLSDPTDFNDTYFTGIHGVDATSAQNAAPFLAVAVRFPRQRTDMRHGWKRFAGLNEGQFQNGVITAATIANFEDLTDALINPWVNGVVETFRYAVVKRVLYHPGGDPDKDAYRLPESAGEYVSYFPNQRIIQEELSSQNSRKTGRGS